MDGYAFSPGHPLPTGPGQGGHEESGAVSPDR
jgi:hypothetical protein